MRTLIDHVMLFTGAHWTCDACIQIDGQRIAYAGARQDAPPFAAERTIDGRGDIAMPGLTNAHTHLSMTLLRGVGSDQNLQDWLEKAIWPAEDKLTAEFARVGAQLGLLEQLRFGVTAYADQYFFMDQVVQATIEAGARGLLTRGLIAFGDDGSRLKENIDLFHQYDGAADGRIRIGFGTHAEYTNTDDSIRAHVAAAQKMGVRFHVHISETSAETEQCKQRHDGKTPTRYLADLGMLDMPTLAAHCVWCDEADMDILAEKQVTVAHNPVSNLKLASGVMPLKAMLDRGIRVALGTDGVASNNTLNLWEEVRLTAMLHKGVQYDPTIISPAQVLTMATLHGAEGMGFDKVGMLLPDWHADIILVRADVPHMVPCIDPSANLVYAAQGSDVRLTMVDGRVLYEDGAYTTLDKEKIMAEAVRAAHVMTGK